MVTLGVEREYMFDKVVTPSDVGKLNRLVIPKQHAEKYFPLDSSRNEKGLLLSFEDRTGKPWRFRYSYWNSSQSYVMTKGWSRFVKEKQLDAGDIVSFQRQRQRHPDAVGDTAEVKLFIDCRRRADYLPPFNLFPWQYSLHPPNPLPTSTAHYAYPYTGSLVFLRSASYAHQQEGRAEPMVYESVPVVHGKAATKRLRLFGVNMDCPI